MQTPYADPTAPTSLFSRERRRQRMLHFLAQFESPSISSGRSFPFFLPLSRPDLPARRTNNPAATPRMQGTEVNAA
jgi:hypothetical protein